MSTKLLNSDMNLGSTLFVPPPGGNNDVMY